MIRSPVPLLTCCWGLKAGDGCHHHAQVVMLKEHLSEACQETGCCTPECLVGLSRIILILEVLTHVRPA